MHVKEGNVWEAHHCRGGCLAAVPVSWRVEVWLRGLECSVTYYRSTVSNKK